ncbi:MAG: DUF4124 domain-containing protein [Oleispira sp.]|nr:DUF4124 domain-containing protein [Oleispira sp.]MBL4880246.1 DUF4124 domain-containing protein [Oleispira sp.]
MRYIIKNMLVLFFSLPILLLSDSATAEIYRWVDEKGRVQFSDSPDPNYHSQALTSRVNTTNTAHSITDIKSLQRTAKQLKRERLKREGQAKKIFQIRRQKRLKNEKIIAKKKKKKRACDNAQKKESLAFRQRSKSRNLTAMRKALEQYEKKRMIRINKCQ